MGVTNPFQPGGVVEPGSEEMSARDSLISELRSGGYKPGHLPRGMGMIRDEATGETKFFGSPKEPVDPQAAAPRPTIDPREMLARDYNKNLQMLDADFATRIQEATKRGQYDLRQLLAERDVRFRHLQDKHLGAGVDKAKTSEERMKLFHDAVADLDKQMELAKLRIEGKVQPDLDEIDAQKNEALQQLQADFDARQIRMSTIDLLAEKGVIQDPAVAAREKYEVAGYRLSTTDLRPPQADPYREMMRIDTFVRGLDKQIEELAKPFQFGETEAEAAQRSRDLKALIQQRDTLKNYKEQQLLPQVFPQHADIFRRSGPLRKATAPVVPVTGESVGTVGTAVKAELGKQSKQSGQYFLGQRINKGGRRLVVVGFDTDGTPLVEEAR